MVSRYKIPDSPAKRRAQIVILRLVPYHAPRHSISPLLSAQSSSGGEIPKHNRFVAAVCPQGFSEHHQIVDILGVHTKYIFIGIKVKKVYAAVLLLPLYDLALRKSFPILTAAREPELFECSGFESLVHFQ